MKASERAAALAAILDQSGLLPPGTHAEVEILAGRERQHARKKRGDSSHLSEGDSLFVSFAASEAEATMAPAASTPIAELMAALHQAEQTPGHGFVSLKWFRDSFLPHRGYAWAQDGAQRQQWLREAINRRWITTDRLANPRHPAFPTTAIRLNRAIPEVGRILGLSADSGFGWTPVEIPGEPMSATVLSGRG